VTELDAFIEMLVLDVYAVFIVEAVDWMLLPLIKVPDVELIRAFESITLPVVSKNTSFLYNITVSDRIFN
jgi:hypothetical protein